MKQLVAGLIAFFQWLFFITPSPTPAPVVPTPKPTDISVVSTTPLPTGYGIEYRDIKRLLQLEDTIPVMPPENFINGLSIDFHKTENPQSLALYQKILVEQHAFLCQMEDQSNWRVYGAHNSYVLKKYGLTSLTDNTSSYLNLLIQNPNNLYTSQRSDLLKVKSHYCQDRPDTQLGFK